jgi:hypothetical protein
VLFLSNGLGGFCFWSKIAAGKTTRDAQKQTSQTYGATANTGTQKQQTTNE